MVAGQLKREFGPILDYEEMISFGQEGLLGAARRFDPTRAVSFRSYAYYRVRGSIIDGARSRGPLSRRLHEKVRALRTANLVAAGFFDESVSEGLRSVTAEEADQRLTDQLSVLATAMALGFSGECVLQGEGRREIVYSDRADETVEHNALMDVVYEELDNLPDQEATLIRRHSF